MIYKIADKLSDYLIAPDGTPIQKKTGEAIKIQKTKVGYGFKLITDEEIALVLGKKKSIRLNRVFTRETLLHIYQKANSFFEDKLDEINYTKQVIKISEAILVKKPVEGVFMEEASEITPEMMEQLSSRSEDQKAASKRVVKSNPKAKASVAKKAEGTAMKFPYIDVDGRLYQSARKAAEAEGVSVNTALKKAKLNKDGWFYVEK